MEQIYDYTIKLIRYVLNGVILELPGSIDFEVLFEFGKSHGVENMLYVGLRDLGIDVPEATMAKFKTAYEMQIMVEATQALELEAIGEAFEEAGIDYVPLKGSVVKYLYPDPSYRKSGDIDILVRGEIDELNSRSILKGMGYEFNHIYEKHDTHAEYEKPPFMILEIHRTLVGESNRAYKFSCKAWNYVMKKKGSKHHYEFEINYLYVYLIAHIAKHLSGGGAGIKLFTDLWLMRKSNCLDRVQLNAFLKEANLEEIEHVIGKLLDKWFEDSPKYDEQVTIMERFVYNGGSFGTAIQQLSIRASEQDNQLAYVRKQKIKQLWKDIFEPYDYMKQKYPILKKYKVLLPAAWIYRWITLPFTDGTKVKAHINGYIHNRIHGNNNLHGLYKMVK